ncbi:MAG: class I SAM-dependent methyltransferase [Butyricicoccus sp.]|nr:class I SAM-dependent methyltransferase [Butyricicoccus sp.]
MNENIRLALRIEAGADPGTAARITGQFQNDETADLTLRLDENGLALLSDDQMLRGDLTRMLPRLKQHNLSGELLVRAAKIKDADHPLTAVDATAGLGEDSLLLAAAGFHVKLFEKNPVIYELLCDALRRAASIPELTEVVSRMEVRTGDSIEAMADLGFTPDVILLDPMFPERRKSALVKNKLQMIQKLEFPCVDEADMLRTAMLAKPKKLIVKRPPKVPFLAGIKHDNSLTGTAVRFDCFVSPADRIHKFKF